MRWSYPVLHWLLTLLIAPLVFWIFAFFRLGVNNDGNMLDAAEMYFIMLYFSFLFSIPALAFYYFIFYLLQDNKTSPVWAKTILILTSIITILVTFFLLFKEYALNISIPYTITALFTGALLKIKEKQS